MGTNPNDLNHRQVHPHDDVKYSNGVVNKVTIEASPTEASSRFVGCRFNVEFVEVYFRIISV